MFWNYQTSIAPLAHFNTNVNKDFCFLQTIHLLYIKIETIGTTYICLPCILYAYHLYRHAHQMFVIRLVCIHTFCMCIFASYGNINSANFAIKLFFILNALITAFDHCSEHENLLLPIYGQYIFRSSYFDARFR